METFIYLHHSRHLCAIVFSNEKKKFVDNVEKFCVDWNFLIDEAKNGFENYPFYDRYKNFDIDFDDEYGDIIEGEDRDYQFMFCVHDGVIELNSNDLENGGKYFEQLLTVSKIAEAYDFYDIRDIFYSKDYVVLSADEESLVYTNIKIPHKNEVRL